MEGIDAAAAAPAAPAPTFSDEAIAMLVALTGGDEASARALLEVTRDGRGRENGIEREGAPSLSRPLFSSHFTFSSLVSLPTLKTPRPPPATSSRPRTSSSPAGSPP